MFAKKNATLIAVEFASFFGLFPTLGVIQSCYIFLKWHHFMIFGGIRYMLLSAVFTQMYIMTDFTVHGGFRRLTKDAAVLERSNQKI